MTPNRLIMSVVPAESATVPRRPGSGHRATHISEAKNGLDDRATYKCKQRPAHARPRHIADFNSSRLRLTSRVHRSDEPLNRIYHY
jgi:hypothetical protein